MPIIFLMLLFIVNGHILVKPELTSLKD